MLSYFAHGEVRSMRYLGEFLLLISVISTTVSAQEAQSLGAIGVGDANGIRIVQVIPGGPAETAGLKIGDVVTHIDLKPVKKITEQTELMTGKGPGSLLFLTFVRQGQRGTMTIKLPRVADASSSAPVPQAQQSAAMPAQRPTQLPSPFTFKNNYLGMTLEEFRANPYNIAAIYIDSGERKGFLKKPVSRQVNTPLCTDHYGWQGLTPKPTTGEIICMVGTQGFEGAPDAGIASRPGVNGQALTVGGHEAEHVWYRFYGEKLYKIEIGQFFSGYFADVASAVRAKFGEPAEIMMEHFQNGYGAQFQAGVYVWHSGTQMVTLREGSDAVTGQSTATGGPEILFVDTAVVQQFQGIESVRPDF